MNASKKVSIGAVVACLALLGGAIFGGVADAKKKKKSKAVPTFVANLAPNLAIPDDAVTGPSTPVVSTATVSSNKYKKSLVADVNVVGLKTTGSAVGAADDLNGVLSAPNGRSVYLFDGVGDVSLGPWTLDDDTKTSICDSPTATCSNPLATLLQPFAGTSNLQDTDDDVGVLSNFDGIKMKGTWTLTVWDDTGTGTTSVLNNWGLQIVPQKKPAVSE